MGNQATHTDHPIAGYRTLLDRGAQLVDVREPAEVAAGSLPEAINIPLGELPHRLAELAADRRVLVFCRSGGRSAQAAEFLVARGFGDVINLAGGMLAHQDDSRTDNSTRNTDRNLPEMRNP